MADKTLINVIIRNTEETLFEGTVDRLTSFNEMGKFDIYPMHANFISIIEREISLYHNNQQVKTIKLERAVLKAKQDKVAIYLGIEALLMGEEGALQEDTPSPPAQT